MFLCSHIYDCTIDCFSILLSSPQILFGLIVQLIYIKLYAIFDPYVDVHDAALQETCQYQGTHLTLA